MIPVWSIGRRYLEPNPLQSRRFDRISRVSQVCRGIIIYCHQRTITLLLIFYTYIIFPFRPRFVLHFEQVFNYLSIDENPRNRGKVPPLPPRRVKVVDIIYICIMHHSPPWALIFSLLRRIIGLHRSGRYLYTDRHFAVVHTP